MTVTALGSPVTAEAFVIASEPAPDQPRGAARLGAAVLRTARTGLSVLDATMAPTRGEMRIFGLLLPPVGVE
jgi:hypothetical protein